MADYKVGNLQIAFEAINNTSTDFKELAKNLRALQKLILNIGNADITPFVNNIKALRKEMTPLLTKISGATQGISDFNAVVKQLGVRNLSKASSDLEDINNATKALSSTSEATKKTIAESIVEIEKQLYVIQTESTHTFEDLNKELLYQQQYLRELNRAYKEAFGANNQEDIDKYGKKIIETKQAIQQLKDQLKGTDTQVKKSTSGWKKFIKSIGRITVYRAIRRALQLITQSITETIQEFAKVDDNVNDTMSHITSSLQVIKLSFGAMFLPLLEIVQPILSQIAETFANFANTISQATATGETYWAINSKAIQDYREQLEKTTGSLAGFDKIQTLNAKDNFSFFEERQVDKESEAVQNIGRTIQAVKDIISGLWHIISVGWNNIVKPIFNEVAPYISYLIDGIARVVDWVGKAILKLDELGLIQPILIAIGVALAALYAKKVTSGISTLISKFNLWYVAVAAVGLAIGILSNWDNFNSETKKTITVISSLVAILTAAAIAALALNGALTFGTGAALAITAIAAGAVAIRGMVDAAKGFANGGIPATGTLFYAGEAGAETVTIGSSGRTEVTNVSQMENALYNALVRYGRENRGSDNAININIDGQRVFEATRRVANRKGLDFSKV